MKIREMLYKSGFCMKIREMLYKGRYLDENKLFAHKMEVFLKVLCKMLINYKVCIKMPADIKVQCQKVGFIVWIYQIVT